MLDELVGKGEKMNKIYLEQDYISAFTDSPCAEEHKHWMMQLFMCLDSDVLIDIKGEKVAAQCILLDSNVEHRFNIKGHVYYDWNES